MSELIVWRDGARAVLPFEGTPLLCDVLAAGGFDVQRPCGGRGRCGKCAVQVTGQVSPPNEEERRLGVRLACQAVLLGDAEATLPDSRAMEQIETDVEALRAAMPMDGRIGAAVDIGTTTLAVRRYDLATGECVGSEGMRNPQTAVAADVMGRIGAAMDGRLPQLRDQIRGAIRSLAGGADAMVVTGNTTMLYLLTGRDPKSLSCAPFEADCLFDETISMDGARAWLPPCMNAFVGADITCAALASGMCERSETALLCDVGTNGEIALWKDGTLLVSSTAAGPAFEGAGISCGVSSVRGAIDRVWTENGCVCAHTIGDAPAVGVCGSGLIDAVAAFLDTEQIDETGAMEDDALPLAGGVALIRADVRAVQLAKAAIAAGILTLLETAGVSEDEVAAVYIAGGFGSHLNVDSAARIGLIPPALAKRVKVLGNAALTGAARLLLDRREHERAREIARCARHVALGGNPRFNERYMDQMFFE